MNAIDFQPPLALGKLGDAELLDAWVRDGHRPALAELVRRYSRLVLSVCRRRCRREADVEDAYQTTFLYLARSAGEIRRPECLPGWLQRVAQRAATATVQLNDRETEPMVEPPAFPDDPLARLAQRHEAIVLDEELAELPEIYRSALLLHLCEEVTVAELAERLETTTGTIRGRLQRGRKMLARALRRRGVVPVVAIASATAWSSDSAHAATAANQFIDSVGDGPLPEPPIDSSVLDPLLHTGVRLMPSLSISTGIIGGTALLGALLMAAGTQGQSRDPKEIVSLPPAIAESQVRFQGFGGAAQAATPKQPSAEVVGGAVPAKITRQIEKQLDESLAGPLSLDQLMQRPGFPVFINERAIAEAEVDLDSDAIEFSGPEMPMRSALRKMLQPHGLQAVVVDEGLEITADFAALSHRGLPMTRWIDGDLEAKERIDQQLSQARGSFQFDETPLSQVVQELSQQHDIPIMINTRALEEIGLSDEEPVTVKLSDVSLRSLLNQMLRELDLTYMMHNEVLELTTIERAQNNLLGRLYYLEGTGFSGDYDAFLELITTSITPETWEVLGGSSTITPLPVGTRPALLVATVVEVHKAIERLLDAMREGTFATTEIESLRSSKSPRKGFGGGGGGAF